MRGLLLSGGGSHPSVNPGHQLSAHKQPIRRYVTPPAPDVTCPDDRADVPQPVRDPTEPAPPHQAHHHGERHHRRILVGAAVVVGVARRGDTNSNTGSGTQASTVAAAPAPRRFDTPQAIVTYLDTRGLTCSRYETVEGATSAVARGRCYVGTDEVTVGVYAIHSDVEAQWTTMTSLLGGIASVHMALGENWTVNGPAAWTKQVAEVMGVEFRQQVS